MKDKILIISPFFSPNIGGSETFLDDLIKYLNRHEKRVDVITYQPLTTNISAPFFQKNYLNEIYRIYWPKFKLFYRLEKYPLLQLIYLSSGLLFFLFFYTISGKLRNIKSIHCHGMAAGFIGYILSFFSKKNCFLIFHTNYRFSKKSFIGKFIVLMIKRFKNVLVLSESCKINLIDIGVKKEKIFLYHNWVDKNIFSIIDKKEARKKLGLNENSFYALFVGRFSKEKGIFDLLNAIPKINANINLLIIGGGVDEEKVNMAAKNANNVKYLGKKNNNELSFYFNAVDILVYAPVDEDYLGRTAISALCCGLPIMIPDESFYGGIKTKTLLKIPKEIGLVFRNNYVLFAEILNNIFKNRKNTRFNRNYCRQYAQNIYGEESNGKIFLDLI